MQSLGRYILSVTAAALLLGMLQVISGGKGSHAALLQLIGGLFLAFTVIAPIAEIDLEHMLELPMDFMAQGSAIAQHGQAQSQDQLNRIIKDRCEAYILDKAQTYQAKLEVEVTLNQADIPAPDSVRLQGHVSPYAKTALQQWLQDEMGIPKEHQRWIG